MLLDMYPPDGGLPYTETNLNHFFPEPYNTITSAFFLIPAIYWIIKLKGFNKNYLFLSVAMYFLFIACIGGTTYHGLRRWSFFIYLDWGPIALLCLLASGYFWYKLLGKWYYGALALIMFIAVVFGIRTFRPFHDPQLNLSLNYGVMVTMIVLPLTLLLIRMRGHNAGLVIISLLSFAVALFFRIADQWRLLSIGTHFLWHTFGVIATAVIFVFIYRLKDFKAEAAR